MATGTVSSANSTSLYSNTTDFTTGLVNSSVFSVNGGTGVTVNPTTGNVVVSIGQPVATTSNVTFANVTATGYVEGIYFFAGNIGIFDASGPFTTSATTPNQVASTINATTYRSAKYQYQITSGTAYQTVELMIIHDGTTAYINTYSDVKTGANLSTFDADISGGFIRLLVTPTNAVTTYKGIITAVVV